MNHNNNNTQNNLLLIHKSIKPLSYKETKLRIYCYLPQPTVFIIKYTTFPFDTQEKEEVNLKIDIETDQLFEGPVFWAIQKYWNRRLLGETDWEP